MLPYIRATAPQSIRRRVAVFREQRNLKEIDVIPCVSGKLARLDAIDLRAVFGSAQYAVEWEHLVSRVTPLAINDSAGGVNPGDRRALYCLVRHLKPQAVLEIGTHIGASTLHVASALHANGSGAMTSVDICDVNDPVAKPWLSFGSTYSPQEMMKRMGCAQQVKFVTDSSLAFLQRHADTFDLIFLDGDHSATAVYQEIAAALTALQAGGYILLHDYFPNMKPLWSDRRIKPGPFLGAARLRREGVNLAARPLGGLPWATKLNSNVTSLALIGAS